MHDASACGYAPKTPYRPEDHTHEVEVRGGVVALKCKPLYPKSFTGKTRGLISTFSRKSRCRMFRMTASIDWPKAKTGLFVTLTFPDEVLPMQSRSRLRRLWAFFRAMEKELGVNVSALWRVEWLPRKSGKWEGIVMPHFHLIIFTVRYFPYQETNRIWKNVLGVAGYVRTETKRLANEKQHGSYIAKYCAKVAPEGSLVSVPYCRIDGQHWGYYRVKGLPRAMSEYFIHVPWETVKELRAIAAQELHWYDPETDKGFCLFGRFGRQLARRCLKLVLDSDPTWR